MLNRILLKAITKQLLDDISYATFVLPIFEIKKEENEYKIKITALLNKSNVSISKERTIRVKNWVQLLVGYEYQKELLRKSLIENIVDENK